VSFLWLTAPIQQGFDAFKKYREKHDPVQPPHFEPPSTAGQPIPTSETSTFVYRPNIRINRILGIAFFVLSIIGFAGMTFLGNGAGEISWTMACVCMMGAWVCFLQYGFRKRLLYCVGPDGLISQHPACPTLIARWSDIFEIRAGEISSGKKRLNIEIWDRSTYMVICPDAGRKETARMIEAHLAPNKYLKAEQLLRKWTLGLSD